MDLIQVYLLFIAITVTTLLLRGIFSRNLAFYGFIVWNIVLALVPLLIAVNFENINEAFGEAVIIMATIVWLLFLPNSYYLLTDMMHLNQQVLVNKREDKHKPSIVFTRGDPWFLLDSSILYLVSTIGMVAGGVSLHLFFEFCDTNYGSWGYIYAGIVLIAAALGIYLGRYSRWNSWDAIVQPHKVILDFIASLCKAIERKRIIIVTVLFVMLEIISWQTARMFFESIH